MPAYDEMVHDLNGARVFTKLDLDQGHHQLVLHSDSRHITTLSNDLGLCRYKRPSFVVNVAAETFQGVIAIAASPTSRTCAMMSLAMESPQRSMTRLGMLSLPASRS